MIEVTWFDPVTPADRPTVLAVRATPGGPAALVVYGSGTPWSTGSPWTVLDPPSGPGEPALVTGYAGAQGLVAVVAVGTDHEVWATNGGPAAPGWVALGSPDAFAAALTAVEVPAAAGPRRFVALLDSQDGLWVRLDPADATTVDPAAWERVPTTGGATVAVATAVATASGPQVVANLRSATSFATSVAVLTGAPGAWQWVAPGSPSDGSETFGAVTGTVAGVGYAAFRGWLGPDHPPPVVVLHGSGATWTWTVVGSPPGGDPADELFVDGIVSETIGGDQAVSVLVHRGGQLWLGRLDGSWKDLGRPAPEDPVRVAAPAPAATVVVSSDGPGLWSIDAAAASLAWTVLPAAPSTVFDAVGGVPAWDDATAGENGGWHLFLIGGDGRLWARRFDGRTWLWSDHGVPAPGVAVRGGGGTLTAAPMASHVVVLGSDGGLWHRVRSGPDWSWIGHGTPAAGPLRSAAAPVLVDGETQVRLCALGDDGRLWVRSETAVGWRWDDRGTPPGAMVFSLVGAVSAPGAAGGPVGLVGFVITHDGVLWGSSFEADRLRWTKLGAPGPGLAAAAGIGVARVVGGAGGGTAAVRIAVMDAGVRHVRVASWPPGDPWLDIAPPPGVAIAGTLGTVGVPDDPRAAHVFVHGSDGHAWELRVVDGTGGWTDWAAPPDADAWRGRAVLATIEDHSPFQRTFPLVCATDSSGSLRLGWPSEG